MFEENKGRCVVGFWQKNLVNPMFGRKDISHETIKSNKNVFPKLTLNSKIDYF